jgi:hypothetical protein
MAHGQRTSEGDSNQVTPSPRHAPANQRLRAQLEPFASALCGPAPGRGIHAAVRSSPERAAGAEIRPAPAGPTCPSALGVGKDTVTVCGSAPTASAKASCPQAADREAEGVRGTDVSRRRRPVRLQRD